MGVTDTKMITNHIDQQFKSIRRYNDQLYGEITLVEQKHTRKLYALVEKVLTEENEVSQIKQMLQNKKQLSEYLMNIHSYYSCKIDYCSNLEKFYFLVQYSNCTLYEQMTQRLQNNNPFTFQQLTKIFSSYVEILGFLKDKRSRQCKLISNHTVIYSQDSGKLKILSHFFKCEQEKFISVHQGTFQYYSPEAFSLYCNKQFLHAKYVSRQESSIVFILGMNFLQCALLADLSGVYDNRQQRVRFDKLNLVIQKLIDLYGQEIGQLISQMVHENPSERPNIQEIKNYIKNYPKRRKITLPKHTKVQHAKPKYQLQVL